VEVYILRQDEKIGQTPGVYPRNGINDLYRLKADG
jgi:hypothetical protein